MDFTNPSKQFNKYTQKIQVSLIRQFAAQVATIDGLIPLTLGQPDYATPDHIKKSAIDAIEENKTTYTPSTGIPELTKAASDFLEKKYNLTYNPTTEVLTMVGATEALTASLMTITNPGDKIIVPEPFFGLYESIIQLTGGEPIYIDTTDSNFILSPDQVKSVLDEHGDSVKAVLLNYPTNPSGVVWTREEAEAFAEMMKDYPDIFIISDEIYSEFIYEGEHVSIAEYLRDQTIVINGVSKSHSMTGWRIGFTFAPARITEELLKVHAAFVTNASSISQYAALEALTTGMDDTAVMKEDYIKRRDIVYDALKALDIEVAKPKGAFYIYAKIPDYFEENSYDFCLRLAEEAKVGVIPGIGFGPSQDRYVRISYVASISDLEEAMNRLTTFIENNRV